MAHKLVGSHGYVELHHGIDLNVCTELIHKVFGGEHLRGQQVRCACVCARLYVRVRVCACVFVCVCVRVSVAHGCSYSVASERGESSSF